MLAFNLIVRAVIMHEGKLLITALDDGKRKLFYTLLGGHMNPGETLVQCVQREVMEEVGIAVTPVKLLYICENFFARGTQKLHEIGYYFLCTPLEAPQGDFLSTLTPDHNEFISPELVTGEELSGINFQPDVLRKVLAKDIDEGFRDCPKFIVINELPGDVDVAGGLYKL